MKKHRFIYFVILSALSFTTHISIAETNIFESEKYIQEKDKSQEVTKIFYTQNTDTEFTFIVQNGEGKQRKASNAVIESNGTAIIKFNQQVEKIKKPVSLQTENELTVTRRSKPSSPPIISIVSPTVSPPSPIKDVTAEPDGFSINTPTQVSITATIPYPPEEEPPIVELIQISSTGEWLSVEGEMLDDGSLSTGDEIFGDGVFSLRKTYNFSSPTVMWLCIKVTLNEETFYSDNFRVIGLESRVGEQANTIERIQLSAEQLYYQNLPFVGEQQALEIVLAFLHTQAFVKTAGISESGVSIWIEYINDMDGGISFNPPGTRGQRLRFR